MSEAADIIQARGQIPRKELATLSSACPPFKAKMEALALAIRDGKPEAEQERLWADAVLLAEGFRHGVAFARSGQFERPDNA